MKLQQVSRSKKILEIFFLGRWVLLGALLLAITFGLLYFLSQDTLFKSEAILGFQHEAVSDPTTNTKNYDLVEAVNAIIPLVFSRSSLEKIISEETLYPDLLADTSLEGVVQKMRDDIKSYPLPSSDSVVIEYVGKDPAKVVRVANELAARFVEESRKYQTERFLDIVLSDQYAAKDHPDKQHLKQVEIGDEAKSNSSETQDRNELKSMRFTALRDRYCSTQELIQNLEQRKNIINREISERKKTVVKDQAHEDSLSLPPKQQGTLIKVDQHTTLQMLRNALAELQETCSDDHPMVVRIKKQIASAKELIVMEELDKNAVTGKEAGLEEIDYQLQSLRKELSDIKINIDTLENESDEIRLLLSEYGELIISAPDLETDISKKTINKENFVGYHDSLSQLNQPGNSEQYFENTFKGRVLAIKKSAHKPATPTKPDFVVYMLMSAIAGLAAGGTLILCQNAVDDSVNDKNELEKAFGIPVICSVPRLSLAEEHSRKRLLSIVRGVLILIWIAAICIAVISMGKAGIIANPFLQYFR